MNRDALIRSIFERREAILSTLEHHITLRDDTSFGRNVQVQSTLREQLLYDTEALQRRYVKFAETFCPNNGDDYDSNGRQYDEDLRILLSRLTDLQKLLVAYLSREEPDDELIDISASFERDRILVECYSLLLSIGRGNGGGTNDDDK